MLTVGVLILGIIGGAYLKDMETSDKETVSPPKTLIEQSIEACDANVESYTNRGLTFKCVVWKKEK
jgi:hypothetical protein